MCGGFVVAYTGAKMDPLDSSLTQTVQHLLYNMGRITSYVLLGLFFGYLGSVVTFSPQSAGYFYFITGVVMVLMGFSLMGKLSFLTTFESSLALSPFFKKIFTRLLHAKSRVSFYGLGMLNGFLPCGLVYFFLVSASSSGSAFWGGVVMLLFGLATLPVLLGLGFIVTLLGYSGIRERMLAIASWCMIAYGIYMAYTGYIAVIA
jgi:uncharacterized protein